MFSTYSEKKKFYSHIRKFMVRIQSKFMSNDSALKVSASIAWISTTIHRKIRKTEFSYANKVLQAQAGKLIHSVVALKTALP